MRNKYSAVYFLAVFFALIFMVVGCGRVEKGESVPAPVPPQEKRLTIFTSLPEGVYLPIVREFENRTGIWVEVETGNSISKLGSISPGEENRCDLIFGCHADVLDMNRDLFASYISPSASEVIEGYLCSEHVWYPVAATHIVIIYNSKLVVSNQPTGWSSIFDTSWCNHVAYLDPDKSDIGYITLQTVSSAMDCTPEDIAAKLPSDLRFETSDEVIAAVASGSCHLGIVPEDVAIRAIADGYDIRLLYPKEGVCTKLSAMAIFGSCAQMDNAQKFIDFILDKDVQSYLSANYAFHSVYEKNDYVAGSVFKNDLSGLEQTPPLLPQGWNEEVEE